MKSLLKKHRHDVALLIGNGINRHGAASKENSWQDLLVNLAGRFLPEKLGEVPKGITLTEFYDLLELGRASDASLGKEFCYLMASWQPYDHHRRIVEWAHEFDVPILTTNFDKLLSDACSSCMLFRTKRDGFTDYYPWESYFGTEELKSPTEGFGIWHVNGMQRYPNLSSG